MRLAQKVPFAQRPPWVRCALAGGVTVFNSAAATSTRSPAALSPIFCTEIRPVQIFAPNRHFLYNAGVAPKVAFEPELQTLNQNYKWLLGPLKVQGKGKSRSCYYAPAPIIRCGLTSGF
jgi:hypothetical protein